jgi:uncharacterized protein (TIGR02996 family)
MRSFVRQRDDRYWGIERQDCLVFVTRGYLGGRVKTLTKEFASPEKAEEETQRLVREKLAQRFVETTRALSPQRQALEDALVANPDDLASHMAYADWLSEQDDPRGEFIQVQLALEDPKRTREERKQLRKREQDLLEEHTLPWLGRLAGWLLDGRKDCRFEFARGWIDNLHVPLLDTATAHLLAHAPELRLLRRLRIINCPDETDGGDAGANPPSPDSRPGLVPLSNASVLGNVRVFQLGELLGDTRRTHANGSPVASLVRRFSRLEELNLNARYVDLDALFRAVHERKLRALRCDRLRFTAEHCSALVRSGVLSHLKVLQLWNADLSDGAAEILAGGPELKRLELLDVSFNMLNAPGLDALRATGVNLRAENLHNSRPIVEDVWDDNEQNGDEEEFDGIME